MSDIRMGLSACLLDALTDAESAAALGVSIATVRRAVRELCAHWGARNRVELALKLDRIARAPEVAA